MGENLHIEYDAVLQTAQSMLDSREVVETRLMQTLAAAMINRTSWQGSGATKFLNWVTEQGGKETRYFINELEEYAASLQKAVQTLQSFDENWAWRIRDVLSEE